MKLSGIEMFYTRPVAGIHETVRYGDVIYMTCSIYGWNNTRCSVALGELAHCGS